MDALLSQFLRLLEPIGLLWLGLLGLLLLAWRRRQRLLAAWATLLVAFLSVMCGTGLPGSMLSKLERPYVGFQPAAIAPGDAVVMLGGVIEASRYEAAEMHLSRAGDRVLMALELIRLGKAPVLVLGGGGERLGGRVRVESNLVRDWITQNGLAAKAEIIPLGLCANTHDEAMRVAKLGQQRGWQRVLLVTSANHLRRATATFTSAGVPVIPCPCNFLTNVSTSETGGVFSIPNWGGLELLSVWMHETFGWYEYRRRGWIHTDPVGLEK